MSDGGPAFPNHCYEADEQKGWMIAGGMTLRDYFAAKVIQGLLASHDEDIQLHPEQMAEPAYRIADAMLKARQP